MRILVYTGSAMQSLVGRNSLVRKGLQWSLVKKMGLLWLTLLCSNNLHHSHLWVNLDRFHHSIYLVGMISKQYVLVLADICRDRITDQIQYQLMLDSIDRPSKLLVSKRLLGSSNLLDNRNIVFHICEACRFLKDKEFLHKHQRGSSCPLCIYMLLVLAHAVQPGSRNPPHIQQ